jgi:hypothetical protein
MKNRGLRARQAVKHSANRARKLAKKSLLYKPISPPLLLADSHLPFLHEGFLHGRSRLVRSPKNVSRTPLRRSRGRFWNPNLPLKTRKFPNFQPIIQNPASTRQSMAFFGTDSVNPSPNLLSRHLEA